MGEWARTTAYHWIYRLERHGPPFADVLCQREEGPNGPVWDALPTAGMQPLVEGVSLEEAQAAVERAAGRRPDRTKGRGGP